METPVKSYRTARLAADNAFMTPLRLPATPLLKKLGFGTGVEVYRYSRTLNKGVVRSPWAVKRITKRALKSGNDEVLSRRLIEEADVLRRLQHPNIVGFRSLTKDEVGRNMLALEDCNISLADILEMRLETGEAQPLPHFQMTVVMRDIASALHYIHTEALILHGDIKSHNVLVKGDFDECKLCDFGVSLPLTKEGDVDLKMNPYATYVGTELWAAPEVFEDDIELITSKCDIYSFGIVIYEMLTLSPPFVLMDSDDDEGDEENAADFTDTITISSDEESLVEGDITAKAGRRPPIPANLQLTKEYDILGEMYYLCTNELAEDRPNAEVISMTFDKEKH